MNDDIFLMINRQFYAFDGTGNPIKTIINQEDCDILKNTNLEIIRIAKYNKPCEGQTFLFTDGKKLYLFNLVY